jgi:hypothetical protein
MESRDSLVWDFGNARKNPTRSAEEAVVSLAYVNRGSADLT